jgi:hypothetical protein
MKITIHAVHDDIHLNAVLFANNCHWDASRQQFVMTRGIGDGYYDLLITPGVQPREVSVGAEGLVVELQHVSDVFPLAALLKKEDDFCMDSFTRMRV